jgi:glycerophosphoryl diester phosphodiesterase
MERTQRQGLPVHVWTVDDPAIMQDLIETGVHGIMTDEASLLKQVAEHNRIWPGVT